MITNLNSDFTLKDCLFAGVKLAESADLGKYIYTGDVVTFDSRSKFLLTDGSMGKNFIIFRVYMSSSLSIDNKGKDVSILGIDPTQGSDFTTLAAEAQYLINYSRSNRKFGLSLHYNGSNSLLFVNSTKIYQFKAKDSEMKKLSLLFQEIFQPIT